MKKKWLIVFFLIVTTIFAIGIIFKNFSNVSPIEKLTNIINVSKPQNTCLTNEQYSEVSSSAPVLSMPFDRQDYYTKHWGIVPFCANLKSGSIHGGLDFELKPDSKVYSATDGVVEKAYVGKEEGSGEIISMDGGGFTLGYSGLTNLQVKMGDKVKRGDYIANAVLIPHGEYHVHLDLAINGEQQCPLKYMDSDFLEAFKEMFAVANYHSQTDSPCACNCESLIPNY